MILQLREHSQNIFFKLLLGFIAITFVISFGIGSFFGDRKDVLAVINSEELLLPEYQRFYSQQLQGFRNRFGPNADQLAEQLNLRQQALQQLISQYLWADEAEKSGILLTDLELQDYIKQQPYFQIDGHFDSDTYQQILKQNRLLVNEYEDELRVNLLSEKYQNSLLSGIIVSDAEVDRVYRNENEKIIVDYLYFDPEEFISQVNYEEGDLEKFYKENPKSFVQPKQFKIEYFSLTLDQFKKNADPKEREITRYYEKNIEDYTTPPEVKARHILIKTDSEMEDEERNVRRKQIEDILNQLKEGADFEELAQQHSEDFSKDNGGDLGWFKPGEMVSGFETAAFALKAGELSDIVETPFGLHIIRVDEKKERTVQSLEEAKSDIVEVLKEARAEKKLDLEYSRLEQRMKDENNLSAIAESFDTSTKQTDFFDKDSTNLELGSVDALVKQLIFQKEGDYGRLKRNPVQGYLFYKILEMKEASTKPFEQVKEKVLESVKQMKAAELASEIAQKEVDNLVKGKSLETIADSYETLEVKETSLTSTADSIEGIGRDPEFKKKVLELNESKKVGGSQYQGKVYLFALKGRELPKDEDSVLGKERIRQQLIQQLRQVFIDNEMKRIRETASIEILNPFFKEETPGT
ncbi:MAG: SurA N-terminal domain-containing protein [SAR324 cluster bacterium]|nr:SurA N-terminal domain-containing protein [SAR324 cluster bacterium]